ncbi:MAG: fibronectin type III domain-containing protein, partial [Patescibacteria group bacterium]|nr:fibronectin type III domain-containing protein [Patescibacteria group bacterium]
IPDEIKNKAYVQYQLTLASGNSQTETPIVQDVSLQMFSSATITLDTSLPVTPTNLKAYEDNTKAVELTPASWYTADSVYFEWDASVDPGHSTYRYCFSTDSGCTPETDLSDNFITISDVSEGAYTFKLVDVDSAENESETPASITYNYDASAPGTVPNFAAPIEQSGTTSVRVNWTAATDTGSGIASYTLERKRFDDDWAGSLFGTNDSFSVSDLTYLDSGLSGGYAYNYRIKAIDNAGRESAEYAYVTGYTIDSTEPTVPDVSAVVACDGTVDNCSNIANEGYEVKITWSEATDTGVGIAGYKIYRVAEVNSIDEEDFTLVGYFDITGGAQDLVYYDNDTNNDATFNDADLGEVKGASTTRLNDYVDYYYRVTAVDKGGYESAVVPLHPIEGPQNTNYGTAKTPDITEPGAPTDLSVTPFGIGENDLQRMDISFTVSTDARTAGRTPTGNGSGVATYALYRSGGDAEGSDGNYELVADNITATYYEDEGRAENTYYYYKVTATDVAGNVSAESSVVGDQTKNSAIPSTPSNVTVESVKGDPNSDSDVGQKIDVSFSGSAIKYEINSVTAYEVYRSETNYASSAEWLANAEKVREFTDVNHSGYAEGTEPVYDAGDSFQDTIESDATTYYYRVRAVGTNTVSGTVYSSLSAVTPGTPESGWDTTPDATAPEQPAEVKVKDIHGNDSLYRNIVTWAMIQDPERNGASDFSHYEVWRYETSLGVASATYIIPESQRELYTDIGFNYYVDPIETEDANKDYSYYVVAMDNAGTEFKYADGTIINNVSNSSGYSGVVSINPKEAFPTVTNVAYSNIGVSTATITWSTGEQNCDSLVEYRVKDAETVKAAGGDRTTPVTSHTVNLVGLEKGQTYEYRVVSRNSLGNIDTTAATTWREFTTANFNITGTKVVTTTTTATVTWDTNINADANVEYKEEATGGIVKESQTAGDPKLTKKHEVVIKALKPDTNYTYKIRSVSSDKYIAETTFATFRTKPYDASQFTINPNASNVAEQNITATSAKIVWETSIATTTWVDFGASSGNYSQSAGDDKYNTVHVVELLNLTPGQTYYYRVRGDDANDVEYTSKEYTFTAVLEPEISAAKIDVTTPYTATVTFNTNVDTEASVTFGESGNFDLKAGTSEYKRNHNVELENLMDDTTYNYYIEVKDKLGNTKKTATGTFATPLDKTGATVEGLKVDILPMGESDETASVIISWSTSKPTTTQVKYDEGVIGNDYGKATIEDESLNTSHTVIIKELNTSTTYRFKIGGADKRGNETDSDEYTFVTPQKERSILQLILRSLEETFSWVNNVGGFFRNIGEKI